MLASWTLASRTLASRPLASAGRRVAGLRVVGLQVVGLRVVSFWVAEALQICILLYEKDLSGFLHCKNPGDPTDHRNT